MRLEGRIAMVTGSSQGIGRGIAVRLAREGADIIVHGRTDDARARETLALVAALGRKACVVAGDLARVEETARIVDEGVRQMGRIDILVNNAGVEKRATFLDVSEADYDLVLDVNLKGVFFLSQAFAKQLRDAKRPGRIINISSVHEELPFPNFAGYCASKGGLKMLSRNLAVELAPLGITINNVAPGAIRTPINATLLQHPDLLKSLLGNIPLGRLGEPEDVAGVVAFLASDDAAYMTGSTVFVDGGLLWDYSEQ